MKFEAAVNSFLSELRRQGYSPKTISAYGFDLEKFNDYLKKLMEVDAKSIDVDAVGNEVVRGWIDENLAGGISMRTASRRIATLKSLFNFLCSEGICVANPTEKVRLPRVKKGVPDAMSQEEVRQLLNAPDPSEPNYLLERAMLMLLYSGGLRVSEMAGLKVDNINLERRQIKILGKGAKERTIPLQDSVFRAINDYFVYREENFPESMKPGEKAFLKQSRGELRHMNVRRIQYLVEKLGKRAGLLVHVHPHLLRHSIASHLIERGANVESVRQTLGHEDLATTSIYVKTAAKFLKDEHKKYNPVNDLSD